VMRILESSSLVDMSLDSPYGRPPAFLFFPMAASDGCRLMSCREQCQCGLDFQCVQVHN
jgi:hypothetical protein